jgi:hypothetical protein
MKEDFILKTMIFARGWPEKLLTGMKPLTIDRSGFKTPSQAQWMRCPALRDFPPDLIIFVGRPAIAGFASDFK